MHFKSIPEYFTSSGVPGPAARIGRLSSFPLSNDWLLSNTPPCGLDPWLGPIWSEVTHSCRKACSRVCNKIRMEGNLQSDHMVDLVGRLQKWLFLAACMNTRHPWVSTEHMMTLTVTHGCTVLLHHDVWSTFSQQMSVPHETDLDTDIHEYD